eukprot:TRINITY_DN558_c0_g1_i13.p3 TRINITY_DN558_c0_g1~~TRINITY_DN558_c0_g1_i13.p3  ORF type:complete len:136 (+),score=28.59 TRINITY_DN558_c0_g1_i13:886-1293(+)
MPGQKTTIVQVGDAVTLTDPSVAWSPAEGKVDTQNNITFTSGLTSLTATFSPTTRVLSFSNNRLWRALPAAMIPNISGKYNDPSIQGEEVTILQASNEVIITNPKQSWSPANGEIDAENKLTFTSGGLTQSRVTR